MVIIGLLFAVLFNEAFIVADPIPKIRILEHTVNNLDPDNPYFGLWTSEIINNGEKLNVKTPIKEELPDTLRVKSIVKINGEEIINETVLLCEALEDKRFLEPMMDFVEPKDKFSKTCPVQACENCKVVNFKPSTDRIPPDTPETIIDNYMAVFSNDEDTPLMSIDCKMQLSYE